MGSKHRVTFWRFFMDQKEPNGPELHLGGAPRGHNSPGRARAPWRAQVGCAHLGGLPPPSLHYKFPNIPKPFGVALNQKFHRRRAP